MKRLKGKPPPIDVPYDQNPKGKPWLTKPRNARPFFNTIDPYVKAKRPLTLLDVGSGPGHSANIFKQRYPPITHVHCVELRPRAVKLGRQLFPDFTFTCADIYDEQFKQQADLVICLQVIEHVENPYLAVARLRQFTKPNGLIIVSVPLNNRVRSPGHLWQFSRKDLAILLGDNSYSKAFQKCRGLAILQQGQPGNPVTLT